MKTIFVEGAIAPQAIAESIAKHSSKTGIGAHQLFLGQVRADLVGEQRVAGIEYSAYEPLVLEKMQSIREEIFEKYALSCLHVYHSLGRVKAGEICLLVFTSSAHRKAATEACSELVERIKAELPIWGKEIFEGDGHQWKTNN